MADEPGGGVSGFLRQDVFGGRLWTLMAAIVLIVGVIAGVVVIEITRGPATNKNHPAAAANQTPGACRLSSVVSDTIPTAAPANATWVDVRGFKLPVSADGPASRVGGDWSCYAHTPMGALEAVMGLGAGAFVGDRTAVTGLLAPGSVSTAELDALTPPGGAPHQPGVAIAGFEFGPFSRSGGQVSVVDSCTIASCVSPFYTTQYNLTWMGRWLITNGGGTTSPLSSAAGVTTWEAP